MRVRAGVGARHAAADAGLQHHEEQGVRLDPRGQRLRHAGVLRSFRLHAGESAQSQHLE